MYEIQVKGSGELAPNGVTVITGDHFVPSHVRHFQSHIIGEPDDFALKYTEALHAWGLHGLLEQHLVSKADSEKRTVGANPVGNRFTKFLLVEHFNAVAKGTNTRKNQAIDCFEVFRLGNKRAIMLQVFEHVQNVLEVAASVIDHSDFSCHADL